MTKANWWQGRSDLRPLDRPANLTSCDGAVYQQELGRYGSSSVEAHRQNGRTKIARLQTEACGVPKSANRYQWHNKGRPSMEK